MRSLQAAERYLCLSNDPELAARPDLPAPIAGAGPQPSLLVGLSRDIIYSFLMQGYAGPGGSPVCVVAGAMLCLLRTGSDPAGTGQAMCTPGNQQEA
jgi:hypothetical protein